MNHGKSSSTRPAKNGKINGVLWTRLASSRRVSRSQTAVARRPHKMLSDPAVALLWNHDHEIFFYVHMYRVLSLAFCSALAFCLSISNTILITMEPPKISPLILASFLGFTSLPFRFLISGSSLWRSIIFPVLSSLCSLYTLLLVFGPGLILPCISSVVLFIPFLSFYEEGV